MELRERIAKVLPGIREIRHDLHQHPEVCYAEVRTAEVIRRELHALGLKTREGLAGGTGTLAYLPATGKKGKTIGLRADIDALPITEETGLPYASQHEGFMHACGHDGHTAVLLGTAQVLSQVQDRPNDVVFIFQPAEEKGAGAEKMCQNGATEGLDLLFGLHGWPGEPLGVMKTRIGAMMASADVFEIVIHGAGGHAAFPHLTIDPIVIASHLVVALQTICSRNTDPLDSVVVTVTQVHAGTATNIIPEKAVVVGTLRTLNDHCRAASKDRIKALVDGIAGSFGATADVAFGDPYPVTVNHPDAVAYFRSAVTDACPTEILPVMGAEDFSYYGKHVPACFFTLGLNATQEAYPGLHTPRFDFNDEALSFGMEAFCQLALQA